MIITRTPLRISLAGGGTDMPSFYRKHGGSVVSFTIDKSVYISANQKFDGRTRVMYSGSETVDNPEDLQHDLARETLKYLETRGWEIASNSDIPGNGTGLGSSSAYVVGLLNAIGSKQHAEKAPKEWLADRAYLIESKWCKHTLGKQDHYAAAYGGMNYFQFGVNESVKVDPIFVDAEFLNKNMILLYTGVARAAETILKDQERNLTSRRESLSAAVGIMELADNLAREMEKGNLGVIGRYLADGWKLKKRLSDAISDPGLNGMYDAAIGAGAVGGKLLGAGGGGFFLFWADPKFHKDIVECTHLRKVPFTYYSKGSEVIYDSAQA